MNVNVASCSYRGAVHRVLAECPGQWLVLAYRDRLDRGYRIPFLGGDIHLDRKEQE